MSLAPVELAQPGTRQPVRSLQPVMAMQEQPPKPIDPRPPVIIDPLPPDAGTVPPPTIPQPGLPDSPVPEPAGWRV